MIGRRQFARILVANVDSAATAYTDTAIHETRRGVNELLT